ncbi:MAG: hypothetical protein IH602_16690 [Bryobacteraceae bacterium]|nr:hypothetical protein [Bryobacteraceae bacterium]
MIPDPAGVGRIYVATYGGSVWHGPAKGDPEAQEDIATPALRLWRSGLITPPKASTKKRD